MKRIELAWMAGLFIGEGTASAAVARSKTSEGTWVYPSLHLSMCDLRTMQRFGKGIEEIMGEGYKIKIAQRVPKIAHHQVQWAIHMSGKPARTVLDALMPYMAGTDKGDQYESVRKQCDEMTNHVRSSSRCSRGHLKTPETYKAVGKSTFRQCLLCARERRMERYWSTGR